MKATVELVRGLPQIQVSEGFESGVLARLRSAGVTEVGAHSGRRESDTRYEEVWCRPARAGPWCSKPTGVAKTGGKAGCRVRRRHHRCRGGRHLHGWLA